MSEPQYKLVDGELVLLTQEEIDAPPMPEVDIEPKPTQEDVALYNHENRIRSLEGQPPLTLGDFLTKMRKA